ncbi:MAG: anthranilate synthase component I [Candidatus Omnitrophica bacterium]|jgi:anthranilate synthase component 1|nr:anthranilate synthase component I [Candidatus Omnitrophota bacterium]
MHYPKLEEFLKLAKKGNVIPVYKEINADLDTPVSAFLKIKKNDYAFLLESVEGQEKIARFSFLGSNPALVFESKGRKIRLICPGEKKEEFITTADPLVEIKKIMQDFRAVSVKGLPRFWGGLVGYIGYDMVRFFEKIPDKNPDDLKIPDATLLLTDTILIFDHLNHTIKIVANIILPAKKAKISQPKLKKIYLAGVKKIDSIHRELNISLSDKEKELIADSRAIAVSSNYKKAEFQNLVRRAKAYIRQGDIIQVVPSQRFKIKINKPVLEIYRNLRSLNPSPYMFFLKLKNVALIGSSPEMLARCEDGVIQTRPIAGTRPRGKTNEEDLKLEKELLHDEKEKAEHIMLVDLGRNDLGRVSKSGRVEVSEFMSVEKYSHVMHLVSEVRGVVDKKFDIYDCLRACFPAGTLSGSPKIRAMEIIDELENVRRGPYGGCVGYFSFSHNMDTCITIRTVVVKDNIAYVQAGAGIVADSVPEKEYHETVNKAKALVEAIIR